MPVPTTAADAPPPTAVAGALPSLLGQSAPVFQLRTPTQDTVDFPAAAQGQPSVLLFWPSWCPYSRALQPYVQSIWEDYRDHGARVWTINIEETADPLKVMADRGLNFPLLLDGTAVADAYGVRLMPALVIVDGSGKIIYVMHEKTTSPVEVAKQVRATLNSLLGEKAPPLPVAYPKPYDLHLLSLEQLEHRMTPTKLPQEQWLPWVEAYLATLKPDEHVAGLASQGAIPDGKHAIAVARQLWSARYGAEQTLIEAPYRAYRVDNHWVVLASGQDGPDAKLGAGFTLVLTVDQGQVLRIAPRSE
jgi:peroxiredoxin